MAPSQGFGAGGGAGARGAAQRLERQLEQQAQGSMQRGDWEGAERSYRLLVQRRSTNPAVYTNLAALLAMQRRSAELEPLLRQALALQPGDPVVHNNLGQVLVQRGELQQAEACFQEAVQLDPAYPQALTNLANLRNQAGALQEAVALYRPGGFVPGSIPAEAMLAIGQAAATEGDYPFAISVLESIPAHHGADPTSAKALVIAGRIHAERLGDDPKARALFQRVVEGFPGTEAARFAQGRLK